MSGLTPYADLLAILDNLPVLVRESRGRREMTMRDVHAHTSVSLNMLSRFERGIGSGTSGTLIALIRFVAELPAEPGARRAPAANTGSDTKDVAW